MAKTELTTLAEKWLIKRAIKNSERFALEVGIGKGRCDFITSKLNFKNMRIPEITCYEIKVSVSDFKSQNGHNLVGDHNYYVLSQEVLDYIKSDKSLSNVYFPDEPNIYQNSGVILVKKNGLTIIRESTKNPYCRLTFEDRITTLDNMLMSWTTGSMSKYLGRYGIRLRNEEQNE